jgi:hypothetical protein
MAMSQTQIPNRQQHDAMLMQMQQQFAMQQQQAQQRMQQLQAPPQGGPPGAPPQGGPPPGPQAPGGADPQAGQQIQLALQNMQEQISDFAQKPTYEDVMAFLRDNRARAFVLDIETDSTIQLDEQKEKQQRAEFMQVLGNILPQLAAMIAAQPAMAGFAGELLKFAVAPYRVGRQLDNAIDDAVQQMTQLASQGGAGGQQQQGKGQETVAAATIQAGVDREKLQWQSQENEKERQVKLAEIQSRAQTDAMKLANEKEVAMLEYQGNEKERQAKILHINAQMQRDQQKAAMDAQKAQTDIAMNAQKQRLVQQGMQEKNSMAREQMAQKAQDNVLNRNLKAQQIQQRNGPRMP